METVLRCGWYWYWWWYQKQWWWSSRIRTEPVLARDKDTLLWGSSWITIEQSHEREVERLEEDGFVIQQRRPHCHHPQQHSWRSAKIPLRRSQIQAKKNTTETNSWVLTQHTVHSRVRQRGSGEQRQQQQREHHCLHWIGRNMLPAAKYSEFCFDGFAQQQHRHINPHQGYLGAIAGTPHHCGSGMPRIYRASKSVKARMAGTAWSAHTGYWNCARNTYGQKDDENYDEDEVHDHVENELNQ